MGTLTYARTVGSISVKDAVSRGSGGEVIVLNGTNIQRYLASSGASIVQQGSNIGITSGDAIGMITTDLVAVMSTGSTTVRIVDLVTTTVTPVTTMDFCLNASKRQQIDGDKINGIAFGTCATIGAGNGNLVKFTSSGPSASLVPLRYAGTSNTAVTCILCKGDDTLRWLLGTVDGRIIEIDENAVVKASYWIHEDFSKAWRGSSTLTYSQAVQSMHYHQGWLVVTLSNGMMYMVYHETGEVMQRKRVDRVRTNLLGTIVCKEGGLTLFSTQSASVGGKNHIREWDIMRTPMKQSNKIWLNANQSMAIGITNDGAPWVADNVAIFAFTYSGPRAVTDRSESYTDATTPFSGRTTFIDDTGTAEVIFDTPILASGQNVPLSDSAEANTLRVQSINGTGVDMKGRVTRTNYS